MHNGPQVRHVGYKKTVQRAKLEFYFILFREGMSNDLKKFFLENVWFVKQVNM